MTPPSTAVWLVVVAMQRLELGKRSLIMSEREIADERGVDFDTLKRQQSEESKLNISLGLPPAAQVQAVAAKYFGDDQLTVGTLVPQPGKVPGRRPSNAPVSPTGAVH